MSMIEDALDMMLLVKLSSNMRTYKYMRKSINADSLNRMIYRSRNNIVIYCYCKKEKKNTNTFNISN